MTTTDYDLGYLQAGVDQLETYLLSKKLFWPLYLNLSSGGPSNPRLTLGNLLLYLKQAGARSLLPQQQSKFQQLDTEIQATRSKWRSAWERKANREFKSRLNQWQHYINDLMNAPDEFRAFYKAQVRLRVLLAILLPEIDSPEDASMELLSGLDAILRSAFVAGDFVWDPEIALGFPQDVFWYLWGSPQFD